MPANRGTPTGINGMTDLIEVARSSVQAWECDQMGHMNVQFYIERAGQGLTGLAVALGIGPRRARREGARLEVRDLHVRFLREQHQGAPFFLRAGVIEVRADGLRVYQEMLSTTTGEVAATFLSEVDWVDVTNRRPRGLPETVAAVAATREVEVPAHGRPRGLRLDPPRPDPELATAETNGMVRIWQGQVLATQCDEEGFLTPRHGVGIVADGIPNLLVQVEGRDRSSTPGLGGAALEYRFVYRRQPRCGDMLTLRSGLKQVAEKIYVWCHWMFDLETGECVATAEAVAIALDLRTRKAIAIPQPMRSMLESRVIAGLEA